MALGGTTAAARLAPPAASCGLVYCVPLEDWSGSWAADELCDQTMDSQFGLWSTFKLSDSTPQANNCNEVLGPVLQVRCVP